jgi:hypothetical protein
MPKHASCCSTVALAYARCGIFGRSPFALPVIGGRRSLAGGEILLRRRLLRQPCEA